MKTVVNFVWRVVVAVAKWFYIYSGAEWLVIEMQSFVFRYKLRVRMVPVSYKLFILAIGIVLGGSGMFIHLEYPNMESHNIVIENSRINPAEASTLQKSKTFEKVVIENEKEAEKPAIENEKSIEELADYIWMKESTRGKKNYSKCEEDGKVNGVGYDIPGDGSFVCFETHEEEMDVLKGWLTYRKALGWSELKMLCTYSGKNYAECK